ncbi:TPM domain-containing protein [Enterococcus rivorum]|uniref:TPM domain-containing protein n=1 Tax=Enterococcus rivorum TaxID=762845 RepID=A0A1E5L194_9ENTE|nr:TPM domain-containing protein [Enterococcus rivorum]MBP2098611.1 uncharacterized protein [Enterococcus rivorum]OEH83886.1 hypothetical protein BCR26_07760 [Enterococcus rivorum]
MKTYRSQTNQAEQLNQKVTNNYRAIRKRSSILTSVFLIVMVISGFSLYQFFVANNQYADKKASYEEQIQTLQQEREDILSGKISVATKSFKDVLQDNLAGLKEYPTEENNYQVPIEGTDSTLTINKNNIFVSDNANILDKEVKQKIYDLNKQLAASTEGAQLQVVTVPQLPNGESIESYANTIFNQLGIGDKEKNNGILYLIALEDRKFRLEVGYGLEGLIPDGAASDIIDNSDVVDAFKDGNYGKGVTQVVEEVFSLMNTKTALVDSQIDKLASAKSSLAFQHWTALISLLLVILISLLMVVKNLRARKPLKKCYQAFLSQTTTGTAENELKVKIIKQTDLYYIMLSGLAFAMTAKGIQKAITQGKLLKNPNAKKMMFGRVLVGDTLYAGDGHVLTTAYLLSNYNSKNWSDNNNSGSGGGSSWGSFGGGSSGGGGASGGW